MQKRQIDLFAKHKELKPNRIAHGGDLRRGKRKITRPLTCKKPVHLVLKSSAARGQYSFLSARNKLIVENTLRDTARKFNVTVQKYENVGNHLHTNAVRLSA